MSQPERCQRWRDVKDGEDIGNERYTGKEEWGTYKYEQGMNFV